MRPKVVHAAVRATLNLESLLKYLTAMYVAQGDTGNPQTLNPRP